MLLVCSLVCSVGAAQYAPAEGFRLERWVSAPTSRDGFSVTRPGVLEHGVWSAQFVGNYTLRPLVLRNPGEQAVVAQRLGAQITMAVGLWEVLEVYARVPLTVLSLGHDVVYQQTAFNAPGGLALSDIALGATGRLFSARGFMLGTRAELVTPSGNRGQLAGDSALAPRVQGLAEYVHGPLSFTLNGGFLYRPPRDYASARIGNELEWGALVRVSARHGLELLLEAFGALGLRDRAGPSAADTLDLLLGGRYTADTGAVRMRSGLALGTGLSSALGEPAFRALFSLGLEPRPAPPPAPAAPKVIDQDHDWVADADDECPQQREDLDGFEDTDGCTDQDNDADGVPDELDHCPSQPGEPVHGCPVADADADGIPDASDRCPEDPENFNGARDLDGCPERDLDSDGLDDDADACPDVTGSPAHAGCRAHARFVGDQIALASPLTFVGAQLAAGSEAVLDDVAALLAARPRLSAELTLWAESLELAQGRVQAVGAALLARGVDAGRLSLLVAGSPQAPTLASEGLTIRLRASTP
ncbi:MAG: thrombospondin type 3 repeat-containing protein [Myxococcales bacterium]